MSFLWSTGKNPNEDKTNSEDKQLPANISASIENVKKKESEIEELNDKDVKKALKRPIESQLPDGTEVKKSKSTGTYTNVYSINVLKYTFVQQY